MKLLTKEVQLKSVHVFDHAILPNGSGWRSTENLNLAVIESGPDEVLLSRIMDAIDDATEMICLQTFLIEDYRIVDALLTAQEDRGVKVYVTSSVEPRLSNQLDEEPDFIKASYIEMLDKKFRNHFIHRSAKSFHAKFILIDPRTNPVGFLCTNNFTKNGFTLNPEFAIELSAEQCEELYKVFVYHFWEVATDEQTKDRTFDILKPAMRFDIPKLNEILLTTGNIDHFTLNKTLIRELEEATSSISFSTYQLDVSMDLIKAISSKARSGVKVRLFCRPLEWMFKDHLVAMIDAGVAIFFHPLIHAKSLLIDENSGYVFTANFTSKGLLEGYEVGLRLSDEQVNDLRNIQELWEQDFPWRAERNVNAADLDSLFIYNKGNLVSQNMITDRKEEKQKVTTVEDMLNFFNSTRTIGNPFVKVQDLILHVEISDLPQGVDINNNSSEKLIVIEAQIHKGKKEKVLVIKEAFEISDLNMIAKEHSKCKLFYKPNQ